MPGTRFHSESLLLVCCLVVYPSFQVAAVTKEAAALRKAAAEGKEGDAQKQLSEQLQRNSELETK